MLEIKLVPQMRMKADRSALPLVNTGTQSKGMRMPGMVLYSVR